MDLHIFNGIHLHWTVKATSKIGCTAVTYMISLTTHKIFQGDTKDTPACQRGGICTHSGAGLLEEAINEPLAEPPQIAVTEETAGVQLAKGIQTYTNVSRALFFYSVSSASVLFLFALFSLKTFC